MQLYEEKNDTRRKYETGGEYVPIKVEEGEEG